MVHICPKTYRSIHSSNMHLRKKIDQLLRRVQIVRNYPRLFKVLGYVPKKLPPKLQYNINSGGLMKVGTFNVHSPINNKWPGQMVQHYPNFCPWSNSKVIKI